MVLSWLHFYPAHMWTAKLVFFFLQVYHSWEMGSLCPLCLNDLDLFTRAADVRGKQCKISGVHVILLEVWSCQELGYCFKLHVGMFLHFKCLTPVGFAQLHPQTKL